MKEQEIFELIAGMNAAAMDIFTADEILRLADSIEAETFAEANAMNDISVLTCGDAE
jgi:hypothetical protein